MKKQLMVFVKGIIFFISWMVLTSLTALPAFDAPIKQFGMSAAVKRLWWEFLPLAAVLFVTVFFTRVIEKGKIKVPIFGNAGKDGVLGLVLGIIWLGSTTVILFLVRVMHFEGYNLSPDVWIFILASLFNVIMQELLVRGYLFELFKYKINPVAAVIITTILFTSLHGGVFEAGFIPLMNVITMSLFVSLLLLYTKNLFAPIMVHFIWNTVGCMLLGGVSLAEDYPSIFNVTFQGNTILSGGIYKMEGSIVVFIINLLLIAAVGTMIQKGLKER